MGRGGLGFAGLRLFLRDGLTQCLCAARGGLQPNPAAAVGIVFRPGVRLRLGHRRGLPGLHPSGVARHIPGGDLQCPEHGRGRRGKVDAIARFGLRQKPDAEILPLGQNLRRNVVFRRAAHILRHCLGLLLAGQIGNARLLRQRQKRLLRLLRQVEIVLIYGLTVVVLRLRCGGGKLRLDAA